MHMIEIKNLTKRYGDTVAVDGLNLAVEQGELFALLGVNGAGKTTAIKMLCCLTCPDAGDALIGGKSIREEADKVKEMIGVSPQETAVAAGLTVLENLELICGIFGLSKEQRRQRLADAMELMRQYKIEPKQIRMVYPYVDKPSNMVLIEGARGGKPMLKIEEPLIAYKEQDVYTDEVLDMYNK